MNGDDDIKKMREYLNIPPTIIFTPYTRRYHGYSHPINAEGLNGSPANKFIKELVKQAMDAGYKYLTAVLSENDEKVHDVIVSKDDETWFNAYSFIVHSDFEPGPSGAYNTTLIVNGERFRFND